MCSDALGWGIHAGLPGEDSEEQRGIVYKCHHWKRRLIHLVLLKDIHLIYTLSRHAHFTMGQLTVQGAAEVTLFSFCPASGELSYYLII